MKIQSSADIFYEVNVILAGFGTYEILILTIFLIGQLVKKCCKIGMGDHVGSLLLSFVDIFKNLLNMKYSFGYFVKS